MAKQEYAGNYDALRKLWASLPGDKAYAKLQAVNAETVTVIQAADAQGKIPPDVIMPWWQANGFAHQIDWPQVREAGLWQEPPEGVRPEDT